MAAIHLFFPCLVQKKEIGKRVIVTKIYDSYGIRKHYMSAECRFTK